MNVHVVLATSANGFFCQAILSLKVFATTPNHLVQAPELTVSLPVNTKLSNMEGYNMNDASFLGDCDDYASINDGAVLVTAMKVSLSFLPRILDEI